MTLRKPIALGLVVLLVCIVVGGLVGLRYAAQQIPEFYARALAAPPEHKEQASREMVREAAALAGRTRKEGRWEAIFTADEINGWLAVDLVQNHSQLLPPEVSEPRVALRPKIIAFGCRYNGNPVSSVLSLEIEPYLARPETIGLRIRKVRAGIVPLPIANGLKVACDALREAGLVVEQREVDGDPLVLLSVGGLQSKDHRHLQVDTLEVRDGIIHIAGRTTSAATATESP